MTTRQVANGRPGAIGWVYWGASGILQPLSEEFLYRSPAQPLRDTASRRLDTARRGRRGAR
ncbi:MAG: hypothetical protein QNJ91_15745 [Gammaproteobacteria bacterium]|nr:hypothetical protein [Gammaproteobacteria bacterium]